MIVMRRGLALAFAPALVAACALVTGVDFDAVRPMPDGGLSTSVGNDARVAERQDATPPGGDAAIGDAGIDAPDAKDPCDEDGDGHRRIDCGGDDCDDDDKRTHPDAGFVSDFAAAPRFGDWNCNGVLELRYKTNASCAGPDEVLCGLRDGFVGAPDCGVAAPYINCSLSGGACGILTNPTRTQGCR